MQARFDLWLRIVWIILILYCGYPLLSEAREGGQPPLPRTTLRINDTYITTELARTPNEQAKGLMHVTHLDDNEGMLFIRNQPGPMAFWMKNTLIPLTLAYIDSEGRILELYDMQPLDTTRVWSKSKNVAYVLEMNQHWFKLNNIKVGDQIIFDKERMSQHGQ